MKGILTLACSCIVLIGVSQQTGSFNQSITFTEVGYQETRTLYYHVPNNYDPNQNYPVVVGFRGGPHSNAGQFRDQLAFLADSIGAIILCPENSAHFWNNEGETKLLFKYALEELKSEYAIDTTMIYLTGLSYGGRHATIVAMDTDDGPIPELRGVIPFAAGSDSQLQPNYTSVAQFAPACICIGLNDSQNFIDVSNDLHNDIQSNGGNSMLNEVPGVGHTVAFPAYPNEMMECINWIEQQYLITGIEDEGENVLFKIYPNPSIDRVRLELADDIRINEIYILDIQGRKVLEFERELRELDVSLLKDGEYLICISQEGKTITQKLQIQN